MINSILHATQIGAGAVSLVREELNLCEFLDEIRSGYDLPTNKEVTLHWEYGSGFPVIETDSDKLKHILQNLIDNAIKFTEKGSITVSVQHLAEPGVVEFKVTDTGVGIPKAMLPVIFEMFRQVDSSERRSFEGVGLGLYIVKQLTELIGGRVEVESEEGKGSTFIVAIPSAGPPEKNDKPVTIAFDLSHVNGDSRI
jgi:signal transduction histidine kinase